ncbi:hypothetical protein [Streptomyces sp. NPDC051098]|uniref:hypothetical protein n=1 Tax=Streptomyces sp. NPDC051098 TaxID=3155411 RepID=UPI003412C731
MYTGSGCSTPDRRRPPAHPCRRDGRHTIRVELLPPSYFADYWGREREFASLRAAHVSGLDANLSPYVIDDRADLGSLTVPALVVVSAATTPPAGSGGPGNCTA